jgi:polysaccharide chain length determinant protein (PEP-CTERM system associated)
MDEPRFDPLDYVSVVNRRKWWFIVPVALSIVVGVWLLPRTYEATTRIAVSSPRVTATVIGAAEIDKQERVRAVTQQLLSRAVLERTARLEKLDQNGSIDAAVSALRGKISVTVPDSLTPGAAANPQQLSAEQKAQLDSYLISIDDEDPELAQSLVNRLAQVFLDENNKSREIRAQDTSQFIEGELRASENRLNALEAKLRQTKESFMGRLPEQTNANLAMVSALQRQLESSATMMRGEQDRLSMIDRQVEALEQGADQAVGALHGVAGESAMAHVAALRSQLAQAQLMFTDKHPEIVRLKDEIANAEKAAALEKTRPAADRLALLQSNPEYRQLTKDREAAKLRIAELQRQQHDATAQIAQYQSRVESAPRVEQQMVSVQREYQLERDAYGNLMQKRQAALLNEELQRKQGGEQFAILVPASVPSEPIKPKPIRVMLMAVVAGFVLGGAGAVGREYLDRSVHDARGLRDEFELPVLAEIPKIDPAIG